MGGLIDFFLSNPFLLIILFGGLLSLFNRDKKEKRERQSTEIDRPAQTQQRQEQRERSKPNPLEKQFEWAKQLKDVVEQEIKDLSEEPAQKPKAKTIEEQRQTVAEHRQQQMDELKERYAIHQPKGEEIEKETYNFSGERSKAKQAFKSVSQDSSTNINLEKQFSNTGLINSIIMKEILDKPRSLNPYQYKMTRKYK